MKFRCCGSLLLVVLLTFLLSNCASSPSLTSIEVVPHAGTATVSQVGQTVQYQAMGLYTNGSHPSHTSDITSQVTWTSSNVSVATISSSGLLKAVGPGSTTIVASMNSSGGGQVSGNSDITSTATAPVRTLTSITVTPGTQTLNSIGEPAQFVATGNFSSSPLTQDMTSQVQWISSDVQVAKVNSTGQATAASAGTTTITAASGGVLGTAALTVTATVPPVGALTSITVNPAAQTVTSINETAQFMAIGYFSASPGALDMTSEVRWISSDSQVATISSTGLAKALSPGTTTITAASGGVVGTATMTVTSNALPHTLTSITIIPSTQTAMALGEPAQFMAMGNYTGTPATQDLTSQVTWSTSDQAVATVNATGATIAQGTGSATITAASNGVVGTAVLTVTGTVPPPRQLTSITVIPDSQTTMAINETGQFIAIGNYIGNPATADLTTQVTWLSSDQSVATVDSAGLATTISPGNTTIVAASSSGVVGTATLTVTASAVPNQLTAINIIPSAQTAMHINDLGQFIAIGSYTGSPSTQDITVGTKWASSNVGVATVSSTGLTKALALGTTTITASGDSKGSLGVVGTATLTVSSNLQPNELTALTIIPSSQTNLATGEATQFIAIGTFAGIPTTQDMTLQVTWSSSDAQIAAINSSGVAIAANTGTTTITAIGKSVSGNIITATATLTVVPAGTGPQLPVLTVYKVGQGSGTVTGYPPISCGSGLTCTGNFPSGTVVTLVADPLPGQGVFGGWSNNCAPVIPDTNPCISDPPAVSCTCKITINNNESVGAIFNLF